MKPVRILGLLSIATAFVVAACTGSDRLDATATPTPTRESVATVSPISSSEVTSSPTAARYSWEISIIDDNASKPSLAVDSQGTPHIAYILEDMPGFVKHAVLGSNDWNITTVATGYFYGPLDIQVDGRGVPHISFHNHDRENEAYAVLADGQWVVHDVDHPGHDGWDNNLSIDSKGLPHTVSIDPSQFGSQSGVEYATFDGESWSVEEVGSGPVPYEFGTGIALDSQNRPHVVWFDDSAKDLKYAIKDGGVWNISTVDAEGDVGRFPSLALDGQGNAVISYYEKTGTDKGSIKLARWDGTEWNIQHIGELDKVFLGHFGARKTSSLVLDKDDNPVVAYSDEEVIKLALWDGSRWNTETVHTAEDLPLGQQVSLGLDNGGVLHLTFADVSRKGGHGVTGAVMYARGNPKTTTTGGDVSGAKASPPSELERAPAPAIQRDPHFERALRRAGISSSGWKTDFSLHTVPFDEILSGGVPRDGIPSIDDPMFISPETANGWLTDPEPVISFQLNGDARAYPLKILTQHEIVNDQVGGVPVIVTFCPLCNTALVFDRRLDGTVYEFGVSGNLRKSDLIMYDRLTQTWWQQLTGEAIVGELTGNKLTFLPASIISYGDFKAANPQGQVLSRNTGHARNYNRLPYAGYDRVDNPPFLFVGDLDGRLLPKERVAAMTIGDVDAAFPFTLLETERVVNYTVGGLDVVIFFKPGTLSAFDSLLIGAPDAVGATGVFKAHLDGRKLTFRPQGDSFVDNETGSVWNILGQATQGPLAGEVLTPIVHGNHFWFAWGAFKPDTKIYQGPT